MSPQDAASTAKRATHKGCSVLQRASKTCTILRPKKLLTDVSNIRKTKGANHIKHKVLDVTIIAQLAFYLVEFVFSAFWVVERGRFFGKIKCVELGAGSSS
jgi:hypothetical protein